MQISDEKPTRLFTDDIRHVAGCPYPFRHRTPLQIRFSDIDVFGHVNNNVYMQMVDIGKIRYFAAVMGNLDFNDLGVVVASLHFDFIAPTHLLDNIEVWTTVTGIGSRSFDLEQRIVDCASGEVKCVARSVMCAISRDGESSLLPQAWIDSLRTYEGREIKRHQHNKN